MYENNLYLCDVNSDARRAVVVASYFTYLLFIYFFHTTLIMATFAVYLSFNGTCEDALNFYATALNGEIVSLQRFGDQDPNADEAIKDLVMHAVFTAGDITFMASDTHEENAVTVGTNVSLSLDFKDAAEQAELFNALAEDGNVTMPLQDTSWGATFGMLIDKFDTVWMFNCDKHSGIREQLMEAFN